MNHNERMAAAELATYQAHTLRDGRCPVCDTPHRCRPWAEARGWLLVRGLLPDPAVPEPGDDPT